MALRTPRTGSQPRTANAAGTTSTPADLTADLAAEAKNRFVTGDARDVTGSRQVARAFPVAGPFRKTGISEGEMRAMDVLLRAMALTMFPNSRDDEGAGGSGQGSVS